MYRGRFEGAQHSAQPAPTRRRRRRHNGRLTAMVAAVMLLLALAIGGTVAWLSTTDSPIQNRFLPSKVSCEVQEKFDGKVKTNVILGHFDVGFMLRAYTHVIRQMQENTGKMGNFMAQVM